MKTIYKSLALAATLLMYGCGGIVLDLATTTPEPGTEASNETPIEDPTITRLPWFDFNDLPATTASALPGSSSTFTYSTTLGSGGSEGWRAVLSYGGNVFDSIYKFLNGYNSPNMGYETYGYFEIDSSRAVSGNSLKFTITGGKNQATLPLGKGLKVLNKAEYLSYLESGQNPVDSSTAVGNPYIYVANSSMNHAPVSFSASQGATALTVWMWFPDSWSVGNGGWEKPPQTTLTFGPFSQVRNDEIFPVGHSSYNSTRNIGNHFYHDYPIGGGGWVKIYIDSHPQHNNAWHNESLYPYPSKSARSIGPTYFNNLYRIYFAGRNYEGAVPPPYAVWFDEFAFIQDPEPQNNETITNPAIMFHTTRGTFEVGFHEKYLHCSDNFPNYELRYSFAPITNANWTDATPAHIIPRAGFNNTANTNGRIVKNSTCYKNVWAEFKLADSDQAALKVGTKLFFAIKDVSQANGNGMTPAASGKGRNYTVNPASWDYEGDQPALLLIKRFDYTIIEK